MQDWSSVRNSQVIRLAVCAPAMMAVLLSSFLRTASFAEKELFFLRSSVTVAPKVQNSRKIKLLL